MDLVFHSSTFHYLLTKTRISSQIFFWGYVLSYFTFLHLSFQAIFRHFQSLQYPEKRNEINDFNLLWKELIRIAKTYKNHRIRIAANLGSVEMFKFMYETENFDFYLREKCICVSLTVFLQSMKFKYISFYRHFTIILQMK